jgi:hypothetical protein
MWFSKVLLCCALTASSLLAVGLAYAQAGGRGELGSQVAAESVSATTEASLATQYAKLASMPTRSTGALAPVLPIPGFRAYNPPVQPIGALARSLLAQKTEVGARQGSSAVQQGNEVCATPGDACSQNWSGLEAWHDTFDGIEAEWTVPTVSPTSTSPEDSSTWIGLDGDSTFDNTGTPSLIQMGTDSPSGYNGPSIYYETWYELLPGAEIPLFAVSPGDQIEAVMRETQAGSNVWDIAISDLTEGIAWSDADISYDSPGLTAEWVEEASTICPDPSDDCTSARQYQTSQLQDFGSVTFTDAHYSDATGAGAAYYQSDYLVDQSGNVIDDPSFNPQSSVTATYGAPPPTGQTSIPAGFDSMAVDATTGDVFVSSTSSNAVTEIDPATAQILGQATIDGAASLVAVDNEVYVASTLGSDPGIYEISPSDPGSASLFAPVPNITGLDAGSVYVLVEDDLVYADGALWTDEGNPLVQGLVKISMTGAVTDYSDVVPVSNSALVADPADPAILFDYSPGSSPAWVGSMDLGTDPPSVAISSQSEFNVVPGSGGAEDAVVSPDGSTLMLPGHPFVGISTSTLTSTTVTYPAPPVQSFATAVAMTAENGGLFAGGLSAEYDTNDHTDLVVYPISEPGDLVLSDVLGPTDYVLPGGLAFNPDGTALYVVTSGSSSGDQFNVVPLQWAPPPPPTAGEGSISGTVTASGMQQFGVCVEALGEDGTSADYETTTGIGGNYNLDDVVPGSYAILFDPTCGQTMISEYARQYYHNEADPSTPTVSVGPLQQVTGIDAALTEQATISGSVGWGVYPVPAMCVDAYSSSSFVLVGSYDDTSFEGTYTINNLPAGSYVLLFDPTCDGTQPYYPWYALAFYSGEEGWGSATHISLSAGQNLTGYNEQLVYDSNISGTVAAPGADDGSGICVTAYPSSDGYPLVQAASGQSGTYEFANLPTGSYKLYIDPTCGGYQPSDYSPVWYGEAADFSAATTVTAPVGGVAGINATVTELPGAGPSVATSSLPEGTDGSPYLTQVQSSGGTDGNYWSITGLPDGLFYTPGGIIAGTPLEGGQFIVTLTVTDSSVPPVSATEQLDLTISGGGTTTPTSAATTSTTRSSAGGPSPGSPGLPPLTTTTIASPTTPTSADSTTTTSAETTTTTLKIRPPPGSPANTYGEPVTAHVTPSGTSLAETAGGAKATVVVPGGALPPGSEVGLAAVLSKAALTARLPAGQSYLGSFAVSWVAPNGSSPKAKSPLTIIVKDPLIKHGDIIYVVTSKGLLALEVAMANGSVAVKFTTDPDFLIANVPQLSSVALSAHVTGAEVQVTLGCTSAVACSGLGRFSVQSSRAASAHSVVLFEGRFSVSAGKHKLVSFAETPKGKAYFARHPAKTAGVLMITLLGGKETVHSVSLP